MRTLDGDDGLAAVLQHLEVALVELDRAGAAVVLAIVTPVIAAAEPPLPPSLARMSRSDVPRAASSVAPPVGLESVRWIVSTGSAVVSSAIGTVKVLRDSSPDAQERVPLAAV